MDSEQEPGRAAVEPRTIFLTLWRGWRPLYDARHVNAVVAMLEDHAPGVPVVCFTNMPNGLNCETRPLPRAPRVPLRRKFDCYCRLWFFSAECAEQFPGVIMNIDLDVIINREILSLFSGEDFRLMHGAHAGAYNGSFWTHRTGTRTFLWDDFNGKAVQTMDRALRRGRDAVKRRWVGSDQRWISYKTPNEPVYGDADGCEFAGNRFPDTPEWQAKADRFLERGRLMFFPGAEGVKPWNPALKERHAGLYNRYMEYFARGA